MHIFVVRNWTETETRWKRHIGNPTTPGHWQRPVKVTAAHGSPKGIAQEEEIVLIVTNLKRREKEKAQDEAKLLKEKERMGGKAKEKAEKEMPKDGDPRLRDQKLPLVPHHQACNQDLLVEII